MASETFEHKGPPFHSTALDSCGQTLLARNEVKRTAFELRHPKKSWGHLNKDVSRGKDGSLAYKHIHHYSLFQMRPFSLFG